MNNLKRLAQLILAYLELEHQYAQARFSGYHGFGKIRFADELLRQWCSSLELNPEQYQVELIQVDGDLTAEKHHHENSDAFVVVLGLLHHFPLPSEHFVQLVAGCWVPAHAETEIEIPAGTVHGFTILPGYIGVGYFLSIQTPPIVSVGGADDYIRDS